MYLNNYRIALMHMRNFCLHNGTTIWLSIRVWYFPRVEAIAAHLPSMVTLVLAVSEERKRTIRFQHVLE